MMRSKIVDRGFGYSSTQRVARDLTAAAVAAACLAVSLAILSIRFVSTIA